MKKFTAFKIVGIVITLFFGQVANSQENDLRFADPLTDNMVVQQNQPFTVWGNAKKGEKITITADWSIPVTVEADDKGWFKGIITVPKVEKGDFSKHTLSISNGEQTRTLKNLLIGELWICSGQSNMQFSLKEVINAEEELKKVDQPNIRLFNTGLNFSDTPLMNISGSWKECTIETARDFSAVGYFFGKKLYDRLQVPVGLLFTGIGASAAQAYVPREVLASNKILDSVYLHPYLNSDKSKEKIDGGFSFEKVTRPYLLYNAIINPLTNLSIKGVVWYQGESNRDDRTDYTLLMHAMIQSWREEFSQGNFPFYFVQVAPYFYDMEDPTLADYAFFREAQENILSTGNTEMVVTMDVGEAKDLHPKNKKPIGDRLARTALNQTYGYLEVKYQGPQFRDVDFKANKALVSFTLESIAGGLMTNDGQAPRFFELAGSDGVFHLAQAKIIKNQIEVTSKEVPEPVAVRYAFTNYPVTNLENKEGLPAVPFRSDDWDEKPKKK